MFYRYYRSNEESWARSRIAGLSANLVATSLVVPMDLLKTRIQLLGEGRVGYIRSEPVLNSMYANTQGGSAQFFVGTSAALYRTTLYTFVRMGLYARLYKHIMRDEPRTRMSLFNKSYAMALSSGVAALVSNPFELVFLRQQADTYEGTAHKRNYRNPIAAISQIRAEGGNGALFTGAKANFLKVALLNATMVAPFEVIRAWLKRGFGDWAVFNLFAAGIAAVPAAMLSLPFDNIKTKLQNQPAAVNGRLQYNGVLDCAHQTFAKESYKGFYRGFGAYYMRVTPHAIFALLTLDFVHKVYDLADGH